MNWTGGRLQRASNTKNKANGVVGRQKQHFARVRTQLQNGIDPLQQPFKPAFFDTSVNFELDGRSQHNTPPQKALRDEDRGSDRAAAREEEIAKNGNESATTAATYMKESSRTSLRKTTRLARAQCEDIVHTRKQMQVTESVADRDLEDERHRLLHQGDWVGLAPMQTSTFEFASARERDQIGKRRKVTKSRATHLNELRERPVPLPLAPHERLMRPFEGTRHGSHRPDSGSDTIQIRVGTAALQSQFSPKRAAVQRSTLVSSDSMLLDAESTPCDLRSGGVVQIPVTANSQEGRNDRSFSARLNDEAALHEHRTAGTATPNADAENAPADRPNTVNRQAPGCASGRAIDVAALSRLTFAPELVPARRPFRALEVDNEQRLRRQSSESRDLAPNAAERQVDLHPPLLSVPAEEAIDATDVTEDDGPWRAFLSLTSSSSGENREGRKAEAHKQHAPSHAIRRWDIAHDAFHLDRQAEPAEARRGLVEPRHRQVASSKAIFGTSESSAPYKAGDAEQKTTNPAPRQHRVAGNTEAQLWRNFIFGEPSPEASQERAATENPEARGSPRARMMTAACMPAASESKVPDLVSVAANASSGARSPGSVFSQQDDGDTNVGFGGHPWKASHRRRSNAAIDVAQTARDVSSPSAQASPHQVLRPSPSSPPLECASLAVGAVSSQSDTGATVGPSTIFNLNPDRSRDSRFKNAIDRHSNRRIAQAKPIGRNVEQPDRKQGMKRGYAQSIYEIPPSDTNELESIGD